MSHPSPHDHASRRPHNSADPGYERFQLTDLPARWWGWGEPGALWPDEDTLERFRRLLHRRVGTAEPGPSVPGNLEASIPEPRLDDALRQRLIHELGPDVVAIDPVQRALHTHGRGFLDLLRCRRLDFDDAPDAVLLPRDEDQVHKALRIARDFGAAVVPWGGGSTVVGGVAAGRQSDGPSVLVLDLSRLGEVLAVDRAAQTVRVQAGIRGPVLEHRLGAHGFTLGHFPQSFDFSTLGGWIATRSVGQESARYGPIARMVRSLRVITPQGAISTHAGTTGGAGPELLSLLAGSEGVYGVITEATLAVHRVYEHLAMDTYLLPDVEAGFEAVQSLVQQGLRPAVCRLSDPVELSAARALEHAPAVSVQMVTRMVRLWLRMRGTLSHRSSLLLLSFAGSRTQAQAEQRQAQRILRQQGAVSVGGGPTRRWYETRFLLPYLRDDLLTEGYLTDTFETGVTWERMPDVYAAGRKALQESLGRSLVMVHLSNATPDGACLYFTAIAPLRRGRETEQWHEVKQHVTQAFLDNGGSLSHHHGIGRAHRQWLARAHDPASLALMQQVKRHLDPSGIMNPGKLLPD